MSDHKRTSAADWAAKGKTRLLELPSGAVVEVIDSRMHLLAIANILPSSLVATALEVSREEGTRTAEEYKTMLDGLIKLMEVVCRIVVAPKISMNPHPAEGEISIMQIPDDDIGALIAFTLRKKEAGELTPFRPGANGSSAGPVLPPVRPEAVGGDGIGG